MECLFNTHSNNIVAYRKHHHCGMTVKQMKCKNCLGKQCHYFVKNEKHDYWRQKAQVKKYRQDRKQAINAYIESLQRGGNEVCCTTNS